MWELVIEKAAERLEQVTLKGGLDWRLMVYCVLAEVRPMLDDPEFRNEMRWRLKPAEKKSGSTITIKRR